MYLNQPVIKTQLVAPKSYHLSSLWSPSCPPAGVFGLDLIKRDRCGVALPTSYKARVKVNRGQKVLVQEIPKKKKPVPWSPLSPQENFEERIHKYHKVMSRWFPSVCVPDPATCRKYLLLRFGHSKCN